MLIPLYIMQLYISVCTVPLAVNEVKKLIPAERELCIPVPSKVYTPTKHSCENVVYITIVQEMVRYKYAQELVGQNWRKIKV